MRRLVALTVAEVQQHEVLVLEMPGQPVDAHHHVDAVSVELCTHIGGREHDGEAEPEDNGTDGMSKHGWGSFRLAFLTRF